MQKHSLPDIPDKANHFLLCAPSVTGLMASCCTVRLLHLMWEMLVARLCSVFIYELAGLWAFTIIYLAAFSLSPLYQHPESPLEIYPSPSVQELFRLEGDGSHPQ